MKAPFVQGCFHGEVCFSDVGGGFIFKWGDAPWVGIGFDVGREFRKKGGVSPHAPHTMGNPAWGVTNFLV